MKHSILLLAFILCAQSCKKKTFFVPVNSELKKHYNFLPGTYWIYRDSTNGVVDSFVVMRNMDSVITIASDGQEAETLISISEYHNLVKNDTSSISIVLYDKFVSFAYVIKGMPSYGAPSFNYFAAPTFSHLQINGISYLDVRLNASNEEAYYYNDLGFIKFSFPRPKVSSKVIWELLRSNIKLNP